MSKATEYEARTYVENAYKSLLRSKRHTKRCAVPRRLWERIDASKACDWFCIVDVKCQSSNLTLEFVPLT